MDKRGVTLDGDLPFGALRLPDKVERIRVAANRLSGGTISRRFISLARRAVLFGREDPLDVEIFGECRARLYPRSNRCEKRVFLGVNSWDLPERQAIAEALAEKPSNDPFVFIDGGANVGMYSLFAASEAKCMQRPVKILAIEPDPQNLSRLRFNLMASGLSDNIHVAPYALGDRPHTGHLLSDQSNRGEVRLANGHETVDSGVEVVIRPLADILNDEGIGYVDCLKLDIEGAEFATLSSLFSDADNGLWPSMIILEVGKTDQMPPAYHLCMEKGYVLARRTSLNAILCRAGTTEAATKMETGI